MTSEPVSNRTLGTAQSQDSSMKPPTTPDSAAHARLTRAVRHSTGWSPTLQSGLGVLDDATATALASMLEQLRAQAEQSRRGGWVRGFSAGQQF